MAESSEERYALLIEHAFVHHPSDDEMELYSMGTLSEQDSIALEEHVLICTNCQERLCVSDDYVRLMKEVSQQITKREGDSLTDVTQDRDRRWIRFANISSGPWAAIAAAVVVILGFAIYRSGIPHSGASPFGEVSVELQAIRGAESPSIVASSAASLRLSMDTTGLPAGGLLVTLVSANGTRVWSGTTESKEHRATAVIVKNLEPGQYWVRLSSATELLREYGLRIR